MHHHPLCPHPHHPALTIWSGSVWARKLQSVCRLFMQESESVLKQEFGCFNIVFYSLQKPCTRPSHWLVSLQIDMQSSVKATVYVPSLSILSDKPHLQLRSTTNWKTNRFVPALQVPSRIHVPTSRSPQQHPIRKPRPFPAISSQIIVSICYCSSGRIVHGCLSG